MDKGIRNTLLGIAAFISVILGLLVASIVLPKPMTPEEEKQLGFYHFDKSRPVLDFTMTDHLGKTVGLKDIQGSWSLLFFGFTTCPDICPTTLSVLSDAVNDMQTPPQVVMVSVDPDRDTPEKLKQYVPAFNPNFRGFTGTFDQTVELAQQLNVAFGKVPGDLPGTYLVDHTASLVLINPDGHYTGFIKAPHNAHNIARIMNSLD